MPAVLPAWTLERPPVDPHTGSGPAIDQTGKDTHVTPPPHRFLSRRRLIALAGLALAEEPEGDLERVTWPDFVTASAPEIRELYELHVTNGGLMR